MSATTVTTSTGAKVRTTTIKATAPAATAPTGMNAITALVAAATAPAATAPAATAPAATAPAATAPAPTVDPLAGARAEFANALGEANKSSDRWTQNFAAALNEHLPTEWWALDHKDESADGKAVRREQKATYSALKAAGYSNPSVAWKRVRNAAAVLKGWIDCETEEEEEEEETEASKAASKYAKVQALIADAVKKLGKMDVDHGAEMKALADIAKRLPSL